MDEPFKSLEDSQDPSKLALTVYSTLLGVTSNSSLVDINFQPDMVLEVVNSDIFVCFNYLILSTLSRIIEGMESDTAESTSTFALLQDALTRVVDRAERSVIWIQ